MGEHFGAGALERDAEAAAGVSERYVVGGGIDGVFLSVGFHGVESEEGVVLGSIFV